MPPSLHHTKAPRQPLHFQGCLSALQASNGTVTFSDSSERSGVGTPASQLPLGTRANHASVSEAADVTARHPVQSADDDGRLMIPNCCRCMLCLFV